ncbi:MAG: ABC transporter ATP-binding protein [Acidimicrobiales bacterium]|nr:ABC transporter ATP-binding protein [Acidimicrobiales bacterium]
MVKDPSLPAIEVKDLSTSYRVHIRGSSVLGGITDLFRLGQSTDRVIPAVKDVSFAVPQGSVLGVIGRNGAGKSTLLRCLAGILAPESGTVTVRGRISTLITIGVGMNQNLTGRENIRLGGLAMGLDKDRVEATVDQIAEFAQLGEYVDFPVETYSSGMRSRLGFAVMAHLDPEVLLIDEALAGGDSKFQAETAHKMAELCGNGRTIVLVSHSLTAIRTMATQCIWMHQGRVIEEGDPDDVAASYMRYCRLSDSDLLDDT